MLLLISSIMIIAYTFYFSFYVRSKGKSITFVTSKCISMALGMISSTMIGLFTALYLPNDLAISTIISIIIGTFAAILISYPFGVNGIIEAISSSLMGAMMGAMLGDMLNENNSAIMIISIDIIYLFSILSFMFLLKKEAIKEQHIAIKPARFLLSFVISLSILGLSTLFELPTLNCTMIIRG